MRRLCERLEEKAFNCEGPIRTARMCGVDPDYAWKEQERESGRYEYIWGPGNYREDVGLIDHDAYSDEDWADVDDYG